MRAGEHRLRRDDRAGIDCTGAVEDPSNPRVMGLRRGRRVRRARAALEPTLGDDARRRAAERFDPADVILEAAPPREVAVAEAIERLMRDVLEVRLPEQRDEVVLRRHVANAVAHDEADEPVELGRRDPGQEHEHADAVSEELIRNPLVRRARLPERDSAGDERIRRDVPRQRPPGAVDGLDRISHRQGEPARRLRMRHPILLGAEEHPLEEA